MVPTPPKVSCTFLFFEGELIVPELLSQIDDILRVLKGKE